MSRTFRKSGTDPWSQEEYDRFGYFHQKRGISLDNLNARIKGDLNSGQRNAAAWFRRQQNRIFRSKVNALVRKILRLDNWDSTSLPPHKRSVNWDWF